MRLKFYVPANEESSFKNRFFSRRSKRGLLQNDKNSVIMDIYEEIAEFFHESIASVKAKCAQAHNRVNRLWQEANPQTPEERICWYRTTDAHIYEGANWHEQHMPIRRAIAKKASGKILCFGSGIGTEGIIAAEMGKDVTFYDLDSLVYKFLKFRVALRNLKNITFITDELEEKRIENRIVYENPAFAKYDTIISIDVLEHLEHPQEVLNFLGSRLQPNGVFLISAPFCKIGYFGHLPQNQFLDIDLMMKHARIKNYRKEILVSSDVVGFSPWLSKRMLVTLVDVLPLPNPAKHRFLYLRGCFRKKTPIEKCKEVKHQAIIMKSINKTLDLNDLKDATYAEIVKEIEVLMRDLSGKGLQFTTYQAEFGTGWGQDNLWLTRKFWEMCTVIANSDLKPGLRILDCGGASTIFSFYLASKGFDVYTADIDWRNQGIVTNAESVARSMGWNMRNIKTNMASLPFENEQFDRIFSICVLEHLPRNDAMKAIREMARVLKPGGIIGLTFDYGPDAYEEKYADVEEINARIILPSGLRIRGNKDYQENSWFSEKRGKTWGALFLEKPVSGVSPGQELLLCSHPQGRSLITCILFFRRMIKMINDWLWSIGINRRNKVYRIIKSLLRRP